MLQRPCSFSLQWHDIPNYTASLCTLQRRYYWPCFTLGKHRNRKLKWLMGDSPSFLHRWKKPLFPWGQWMLSLSCIFILWEMVMMSGLYPSIPVLLAIPNQPAGGRKPGWQVLSHQPAGSFRVPRRELGSYSWRLFDLGLSRAGYLYLYLYLYCCWMVTFIPFVLHTFLS